LTRSGKKSCRLAKTVDRRKAAGKTVDRVKELPTGKNSLADRQKSCQAVNWRKSCRPVKNLPAGKKNADWQN
jgi:hypothetical protein